MPRITAPLRIVSKFGSMHSSEGRLVRTLIPRKLETDDPAGGRELKEEANPAEPIVAFSRPPPLPPVVGPLVALTLLDSWLKRDSTDD